MNSKSQPKKIIKVFVVVISLFLPLLIVEIAYAIFVWKPATHYAGFPAGDVVQDPVIGWDIPANMPPSDHYYDRGISKIWSNEIGCFDHPQNIQAGQPYIYIGGDSFAWGFSPFEDKFGAILESRLRLPVVKCGVVAYGLRQSLLKAKKTISKLSAPPRIIILTYFWNDMIDDYLFPHHQVKQGYRVPHTELNDFETGESNIFSDDFIDKAVRENAREYSPLLPRLIRKILGVRHFDLPLTRNVPYGVDLNALPFCLSEPVCDKAWIDKAWSAHIKNISDFSDFAHSMGSELLVVIVPLKQAVYPSFDKVGIVDEEIPSKRLILELEKLEVPYLDLYPSFKAAAKSERKRLSDEDLYWDADIHWNAKGNSVAAREIERAICSNPNLQICPEKTH